MGTKGLRIDLWETKRIGDVVALQRGYDLPEYERAEGVVPVYGSFGITGYHNIARAKGPGVTIGRSGASFGVVNYSQIDFWPHNAVLFVTDFKGNFEHFIYYLFNAFDFSHLNSGSAQPSLNRNYVYTQPVKVPPIATQRKIAGVLGAYDELIENNRRRIEILEEMARRLYREWFVQFRFPGHAHVPLTDSPLGKIPKGWEVKTLDELCVQPNGIQTGPFGSQLHQSDYTDAGIPVVMPKDIIDSRVSVETIARVPQSICDRLAKHKLEPGDIVLARRGDIGRRSFVTRRQIGWMCGTGCMRLRPAPAVVLPRFLFDAVGSPENIGLIASRAAGAIMPNLNGQVLASIPIVIPPRNVQERYCGIVEPIFELVAGLFERNANLQTTRDLLLPRLISGELDVSELPIEVELSEGKN